MTVNTITNITTKEFRLILKPTTLNYRNQFRNAMEHQLNHSTRYQIPWIERFENIEVIDNNEIIEINNSTSSERRIEFMRSIINQENINDNSSFLITNSSNQVRTYLHDLLIKSASNININEIDLYRIGNIYYNE